MAERRSETPNPHQRGSKLPRPREVLSQDNPVAFGRFQSPAPEGSQRSRLPVRTSTRHPVTAPSKELPPMRVWPSEKPPITRSDPENPIRDELILDMEATFQAKGRIGMQEVIYAYVEKRLQKLNDPKLDARERANEEQSWRHLIKDRDDETYHVGTLLQLLSDLILVPLLRGELAYEICNNTKVREFYEKHMQVTRFTATPCIYMNLLHDRNEMWLSSESMSKLIKMLERYITIEANEESRSNQIAIDACIFDPSKPKSGDFKLRWFLDKSEERRSKAVIQEWIDLAKKRYCTAPTDPATKFKMGPIEVGWAFNAYTRAAVHRNNTSTTYIFGLLNGICRARPPLGFSFPEPTQLILFLLWDRNENLCKVGEVLGSLIAASYWKMGGANCWYAGGFKWDNEFGNDDISNIVPPHSEAHQWGDNVRAVYRRLAAPRPMDGDLEKLRRLDEDLAAIVNFSIRKFDSIMKELRNKVAEVDRKTAQVQAENKALQAKKAGLEKQVDEKLKREVEERRLSEQDLDIANRLRRLRQIRTEAQQENSRREAELQEWRRERGS